MKKLLALLLTLAMTLSLAACGSNGDSSTEQSGDDTTTEESSGDTATYSFTVGTNTAEDSVNHLLAAKFKELIEERSGGSVTVVEVTLPVASVVTLSLPFLPRRVDSNTLSMPLWPTVSV